MKKILLLATIVLFSCQQAEEVRDDLSEKPRLFVLTDFEADPDDHQSLVRLLLYSNQMDIEGLVATTSIHQPKRIGPEGIVRTIEAYAEVRDNLLKHEQGFPTPQYLFDIVSHGLGAYGMEGVGEGKDSPGSDLLIKALEKDDPRPLWISVWGGVNTLAQALWKIDATRTPQEAQRLYDKIWVYTIGDQDDSGHWIRKTFPTIHYIVSPRSSFSSATWNGFLNRAPGSDTEVISAQWLATHIQQGHGPLGAIYPDVAYGMEGDTPSYLGLVSNGLNVPFRPDLGGWGGRYRLYIPEFLGDGDGRRPSRIPIEPETRPIWTNTLDSVVIGSESYYDDYTASIWRWRTEIQHDFAARMDWCIKPYHEANHPPVVALGHPEEFTVKAGEMFWLSSLGTYDPDGDSMSFEWIHYYELGSYNKPVRYDGSTRMYEIRPFAPEVESPQTLHFILKVTDKGTPALTRYKRVIVTVVP